MTEPSYIELCLRALPLEKQAAARQAFHDLLEGSPDDSMLSRLLLVFEATAAYGRTIPAEIAAAVQNGIAAMDARLARFDGTTSTREQDVAPVRAVLDERFVAITAPLEEHRRSLESVRFAVEHVNRSVHRLRHARVTAVMMLMSVAAIAGAFGVIAYFKPRYEAARSVSESIEYLAQRGIQLELADGGNGTVVFLVTGTPTAKGTDWMLDAKGRVTGAKIVFTR